VIAVFLNISKFGGRATHKIWGNSYTQNLGEKLQTKFGEIATHKIWGNSYTQNLGEQLYTKFGGTATHKSN